MSWNNLAPPGLSRDAQMKTIGLICLFSGLAVTVMATVLFFGRDSVAEVFLGARVLAGMPLDQPDAAKVGLVTLASLCLGTIGFAFLVLGAAMTGVGFWNAARSGVDLKRPAARTSDAGYEQAANNP